MKVSIFLVVLCLGIVFAAPAVDQSVHAEANELFVMPGSIIGAFKGIIKLVVQAILGGLISTAVQKRPVSLETEVNVPADEMDAEFQAGDALIPEPEAQKLEEAIKDILLSMGLEEDSNRTPVMRK